MRAMVPVTTLWICTAFSACSPGNHGDRLRRAVGLPPCRQRVWWPGRRGTPRSLRLVTAENRWPLVELSSLLAQVERVHGVQDIF